MGSPRSRLSASQDVLRTPRVTAQGSRRRACDASASCSSGSLGGSGPPQHADTDQQPTEADPVRLRQQQSSGLSDRDALITANEGAQLPTAASLPGPMQPLPGGQLDLEQDLAELNSRGRTYPVLLIPSSLQGSDNIKGFLCPVHNCNYSKPCTPHGGQDIRKFLSHLLLHPSGASAYLIRPQPSATSVFCVIPLTINF